MDRASERAARNAHIYITRSRGNHYAELRIGKSSISLGRYDRTDPVDLLLVCVQAAERLTEFELIHLLRCDKSQREPNRGPGRRRKYQRV